MWQRTHFFVRKIKANAKTVARRKLDIAKRLAEGLEIPPKEQARAVSVASLNPGDLGEILFGKLTDDGLPATDSPVAVAFTKEKIVNAHKKVQYM